MVYYNFISSEHNIILSIQPKCGCSFIKNVIRYLNKTSDENEFMIDDIYDKKYHKFKKILVYMDPYHRLISYYSRFIIMNDYKMLWAYADKNKTINLKNKTFYEFIYILKELNSEKYQHHLEQQTEGIILCKTDIIINITNANNLIKKIVPNYIAQSETHVTKRFDYKCSTIHYKPNDYNTICPLRRNLYDPELDRIIRNYIYKKDYEYLIENVTF